MSVQTSYPPRERKYREWNEIEGKELGHSPSPTSLCLLSMEDSTASLFSCSRLPFSSQIVQLPLIPFPVFLMNICSSKLTRCLPWHFSFLLRVEIFPKPSNHLAALPGIDRPGYCQRMNTSILWSYSWLKQWLSVTCILVNAGFLQLVLPSGSIFLFLLLPYWCYPLLSFDLLLCCLL